MRAFGWNTPDVRECSLSPQALVPHPWCGLGRRNWRLEDLCSLDIPDWRDERGYRVMLHAQRSAFAWEWLRRRVDFREAAFERLNRAPSSRLLDDPEALRWNLHRFEDPRLAASLARPVWRREAHPWVLLAVAHPSGDVDDRFDLSRLDRFAKLLVSPLGERLLLSDGSRSIRLDLEGASLSCGSARLSFMLSGLATLGPLLVVLGRLRSLVLSNRFVPSLYPPFARTSRLILLLRTCDAIAAGASQADVAEHLLRGQFERSRWRIHSPSVRSQAQRLVKSAIEMSRSGLWGLLH